MEIRTSVGGIRPPAKPLVEERQIAAVKLGGPERKVAKAGEIVIQIADKELVGFTAGEGEVELCRSQERLLVEEEGDGALHRQSRKMIAGLVLSGGSDPGGGGGVEYG